MQENSDLLTNSDNVTDVQAKASQVVTEVTSIKKEEEKIGQEIKVPSKEELVARASSSLIVDMKRLEQLITQKDPGGSPKISRKAMNRILLAGLSLPTEGLPVTLKSQEEKIAFSLCQKIISSRFILTQYHISEELAKERAKKELTNEEKVDSINNETLTNEGEKQ